MSDFPDRVCVVIGRTRHKMIQAELPEAVKRGAKFIELRIDFLAKAVEFKRFTPHKECPWIATIRRPQDGGRWSGQEEERQVVLRQAIISGAFEWIDLETDIADSIRRYGKVKRLVSYHNVDETPSDLEEIYERMTKQDADVLKIAVLAQKPSDMVRVVEIQRKATRPTIAFCMGEIGLPSRFISLKFGAPWIYAAFNKERGIAPGLPSLDEFRTTYPVRSINAETRIFGLLGDPVAHSYGPILHNHTFGRMRQNAIYLPFRVPKDDLAETVTSLERIPVSGYSVTIPHKEAVVPLAAEADVGVRTIGAANTLVRKEDGTLRAANTDYNAAVDAVLSHFASRPSDDPPPQFNQLFVLILGAGGVARAIAHALHQQGAHVTISGRTTERAAKLAAEVPCKYVEWQGRHNVQTCQMLINCTPVGMHPNTDESPIHHSFLRPGLVVFDTVYTPENTMLVREASARGCHVITGVEMFVRQAAAQTEMFTEVPAPFEKMREIMRKAISPVTYAIDEEDEEQDGDDEE